MSAEYCCNRLTCEEHTIWRRDDLNVCFLCCLGCSSCQKAFCAKGHVVCKDCLADEEEIEESWERKENLDDCKAQSEAYLE